MNLTMKRIEHAHELLKRKIISSSEKGF